MKRITTEVLGQSQKELYIWRIRLYVTKNSYFLILFTEKMIYFGSFENANITGIKYLKVNAQWSV